MGALQNVKKLILTERHSINNICALDDVHIFYEEEDDEDDDDDDDDDDIE